MLMRACTKQTLIFIVEREKQSGENCKLCLGEEENSSNPFLRGRKVLGKVINVSSHLPTPWQGGPSSVRQNVAALTSLLGPGCTAFKVGGRRAETDQGQVSMTAAPLALRVIDWQTND